MVASDLVIEIQKMKGHRYELADIYRALKGDIPWNGSFYMYVDMANALGFDSTDHIIESAKGLPRNKRFVKPDEYGPSLRILARANNIPNPDITKRSGYSDKTRDNAHAGKDKVSDNAYRNFARVLDTRSVRVVDAAQEVLFNLIYMEHFPEILRHFRKRSSLTQEQVGYHFFNKKVTPDTAKQYVYKIEAGKIRLGYKSLLYFFRRAELTIDGKLERIDSMHKLIELAGLQDKYPNKPELILSQLADATPHELGHVLKLVREKMESEAHQAGDLFKGR